MHHGLRGMDAPVHLIDSLAEVCVEFYPVKKFVVSGVGAVPHC